MSVAQKKIDEGAYPKDIKDAVERWDDGQAIWTVEMGGLGPNYELAIQVGLFETLRRLIDVEIPEDPKEGYAFINDKLKEAVKEEDGNWLSGLSGAQANAIINLANNFKKEGWLSTETVQDRMILVSKPPK